MYKEVINFMKSLYPQKNPVPLHEPVFFGNEKKYLNDCIDTTFVSYAGKYVTKFEEMTAQYTGAKYAVAVVNGTAALQMALQLVGVKPEDEVITQPLTFVATANAISHCGAVPVFVDVDKDTMGMSPEKLNEWLSKNTKYDSATKGMINRLTNRAITAIVPMHTFGFPCRIDEIVEIACQYKIPVVEDSAESLGSFYLGKHTGTFGEIGIFSYNGNKIITTGGGGMLITNIELLAQRARHITTTAKIPHEWEYIHDQIAYNFRLTNINAAVGVAQMEHIEEILKNKRITASAYLDYFQDKEIFCMKEQSKAIANYWLNCIIMNKRVDRDQFLKETNLSKVQTRPVWMLISGLKMYAECQHGNLDNAKWLEGRIVNIPSGYRTRP